MFVILLEERSFRKNFFKSYVTKEAKRCQEKKNSEEVDSLSSSY